MNENEVKDAELQLEIEKLREEVRQKLKQQEDEMYEKQESKEELKEETEKIEEKDDFEEIDVSDVEDRNEKKFRNKKKILNIVYDICIVAGVMMLLYGGYSFYETYRDSKEAEESYKELEDDFVKVPTVSEKPDNNGTEDANGTESTQEEPPRPREWYEQIWVDLEGMQTQINQDIVGWIFFENEDISYPILYSEDNAEYDRVRYDFEYSRGGSITLEAENAWDFSDIRNVIYGHNMSDESMFGKLKRYNQIEGYYEDHQYFQLIYDGMVYRYQIFSYFTIHETEVSYIDVDYESLEEYEILVNRMILNSEKETGISVTKEDKTVTLLTCAPDNTYRFIVNAVLVDAHAMANADGTYPDTEIDTEIGTETETEGEDTQQPDGTEDTTEEPEDTSRPGGESYTYTEIGKTMWATTGVKVRNQPSVEGVRIGYLATGNEVYVEAVCNETGWYRIHVNRMTGYVNGKYLTDIDPNPETETETGTETGYTFTEVGKTMWTVKKLQLSDQPTAEGTALAELLIATEVYVEALCNETGWYRVTVNDITGYIDSNYLTELDPYAEEQTVE